MTSAATAVRLQQDYANPACDADFEGATTPAELSELAYSAVVLNDPNAPDYVAAAAASYARTLSPTARLALRNEYARMTPRSSRGKDSR